nr:uncharacterized protein LOC129277571 [Lytechinus pictus]
MRLLLKDWSEKEMKNDPSCSLITQLYNSLKTEGFGFSSSDDTPKPTQTFSKDPNVVSSQQEEDDIAKVRLIPPILPRKITKPTEPGSTLQPTNPSRNTETRPSAKRSLHYLEQLEPNTKTKILSPAQEVMIELAREEHAWLKREHELRVEILQLEIRTAQYKGEEARRSLNKVNANMNSDP